MQDADAGQREQIISCLAELRRSDSAAEHRYSFGERTVCVRYLDQSLFALLHPAIAHREMRSAGKADLTIHAFVGVRSPVRFAFSDWVESARRWRSRPLSADIPFASYLAGEDGRLDLLLGDLGEALTCFRDPQRIPAWDAAAPFRDILHAFHRLHDGHLVHGAVIADQRNAVLLAGPGGSGKSSTALACLMHSNLFYLGDDLCLIRRRGTSFEACSLYNSAKMLPHDVPRFGTALSPFDDSARGDGKPTFFTYPQLGQRLAASRPLRAIVLVRIDRSETSSFAAGSSGEAWRAVGPSTLSLLPGDAAGIRWLGDLAKGLPVFWLKVGSRREEIPAAVARILSKCADAQSAA